MNTKRICIFLLSLLLLFSFTGCLEEEPPANEPLDTSFTPPVITEVTPTVFTSSFRDQLSPNEAAVYDALCALPVGENVFSVVFPEVPAVCKNRRPTQEEQDALSERISYWIGNALFAANLDQPALFWLDLSSFTLEFLLESDSDGIVKLSELTVTVKKEAEISDATEACAALTAATADFRVPNGTIEQKLLYINNYLCEKVEYDVNAPLRGNLIGALVNGKCVCEGYGQAFRYLCALAEIDAISITGYATANGDTQGHLWSAVLIDGAYYAIDTTWNDTTESTLYFLVGTQSVCHEELFGETHEEDSLADIGGYKDFVFPVLSDTAYE